MAQKRTPRDTGMEQLTGDHLVASLKQLLINCTIQLRDTTSIEAAQEALLHLEEDDPNFHKYDFVKSLRDQINVHIGGLIEDELDKFNMPGSDPVTGNETLVSKIMDHVLYSTEYANFKTSLKSNIAEACDYLVKNFDAEFAVEGSDKSTLGRPRRRHVMSDVESSFAESSLNQSTVMFMNNDQFHAIADGLDKKKPLELRKNTLKKLLSIATVDIQNCEAWPRLRQALQDALSEPDPQLWSSSLLLLARGLSVNNHVTSKEIFFTLVEYLSLQFHSISKSHIPKLKNGLDATQADCSKMLKMFRLINEFQRQVPQYWVRYPERFVEEVVDSALSLLSIHHMTTASTPVHLTPIHFLSLIDIKAYWFTSWMHGQYSCSQMLQVLEKRRQIVDNAVRSCLDYVTSRKSDLANKMPNVKPADISGSSCRRMTYTERELEFAYFIHSLHVLCRLLLYGKGRSFFPVKVKDREEPVTVTSLIVTLVELLTQSVSHPTSHLTSHRLSSVGQCDPSLIICDVFKKLCASEVVCQTCLCRDDITHALLAPIATLLNPTQGGRQGRASEMTLLQVSDILSAIASTSCGRQHLLYGEQRSSENNASSKSAPIHILAQFARRALAHDLPGDPPSQGIVGDVVFLCRQLYSLCDGLMAVSSYDLHTAIASAWRVAFEDVGNARTPTPSIDGRGQSLHRASKNIVLWEDTLRDNLLNFAATPKGVLLLQQTGAINECMAYLYSRYVRKLQVSKCEKFGYGYMLSQVAATTPGISALQQTGFIQSLVHSLWGVLEVEDDTPVYSPKTWPVSSIDKAARKLFANFVNLLSSFLVTYELLGGVALPTKDTYPLREMPDDIASLFDRLVMVDSEAKIHSLFNYEQSHMFGLRLLSVMVSCLDTFLLLQTQYNLQAMLLKAQAENVPDRGKPMIVDMLSLERNYLLVRTHSIGGPTERIIPPHPVEEQTDYSGFPLFSSFPLPAEYCVKISTKPPPKQDTELAKLLAESVKSQPDATWVEKCRKAFCSLLTTKPESARGPLVQDLMERVVQFSCDNKDQAIFPQQHYTASEAVIKNLQLSPSQQLGVDMTIRYGQSIKVISVTAKEGREKLSYLVRKCTYYLQQQQKHSSTSISPFKCLRGPAPGYDWFVGTVYLFMGGAVDRAWKFLSKFSSLAASAYLWSHRLHCSVHVPQSLMLSAVPPVFSVSCHNVELILQQEVSHVYSAFKMSGFSPAQICQHWIRQCFWNYLDWLDICHYLCICLTLGVDYQVYLCVAILRHLRLPILTHSQNKELITFLKEEPIRGFRVGDHLEYMRHLESKYRNTVLTDMVNIKQP